MTRPFLALVVAALVAEALPGSPARAEDRPTASPSGTPASRKASNAAYYRRNWGIDVVGVHPVSSGYMLRLDYRVVDPGKAAVLADRRVRPFLVDERSSTALAVPAMEKVGELRQVAPLEPGRTYFIVFGNPGRLVKKGSTVSIVAGEFRVDGLVVN